MPRMQGVQHTTEKLRRLLQEDGRPIKQIAQEAGVGYQTLWKFHTCRQKSLPLGVAEAVFVNLTGVYFS